jgi:hypothetical protein
MKEGIEIIEILWSSIETYSNPQVSHLRYCKHVVPLYYFSICHKPAIGSFLGVDRCLYIYHDTYQS